MFITYLRMLLTKPKRALSLGTTSLRRLIFIIRWRGTSTRCCFASIRTLELPQPAVRSKEPGTAGGVSKSFDLKPISAPHAEADAHFMGPTEVPNGSKSQTDTKRQTNTKRPSGAIHIQ